MSQTELSQTDSNIESIDANPRVTGAVKFLTTRFEKSEIVKNVSETDVLFTGFIIVPDERTLYVRAYSDNVLDDVIDALHRFDDIRLINKHTSDESDNAEASFECANRHKETLTIDRSVADSDLLDSVIVGAKKIDVFGLSDYITGDTPEKINSYDESYLWDRVAMDATPEDVKTTKFRYGTNEVVYYTREVKEVRDFR